MHYSFEVIVEQEAKALVEAMRRAHMKFRKLGGSAQDSHHLGSYVAAARFEDGADLEIWLDRASGHAEPMFWVGFTYVSQRALNAAIERASSEAKPRYALSDPDIYDYGNDNWLPRQPIDVKLLGFTGSEVYPDVDNPEEGDYYIGKYFADYTKEDAVAYIKSLLGQFNDLPTGFWEGDLVQRTANIYERDPSARKACLVKNGYACCVCNFDFSVQYGDLGYEFIHVHHTVPLAKRQGQSLTKLGELVPVCPNCHAMLHRHGLRSPSELQDIIEQNRPRTVSTSSA